jgi:fumarylpyruvate hydrolase
MPHTIQRPATPTLAIAGSTERFPVNRIFCVGRNYAAHAREMGKDPDREPPFFFMKPGNAAVDASGNGVSIPYPTKTNNFHHEVELVVAIAKGGIDIPVATALEHVFGYAVGLDMTRRDLQLDARDKGRPWEFGKSFSQSAPIGALHRAADIGHLSDARIAIEVDGVVKQDSNIAKLIWSVSECIAYLSEYDCLEPGDLIMTGTPEGVGPVTVGSTMRASIERLGEILVHVDKGRMCRGN